jgi:hypothetical protein
MAMFGVCFVAHRPPLTRAAPIPQSALGCEHAFVR